MKLRLLLTLFATALGVTVGCGDSDSDDGSDSAGGTGGAGTGGLGGESTGGMPATGGTGGTPATGGAPATGGTGGGASMCMFGVAGSANPDCDPCARQNCCSELGACLDDPNCDALNGCLSAQPDTGTCLDTAMDQASLEACIAMLCPMQADAITEFLNVQVCLFQNCQTPCG